MIDVVLDKGDAAGCPQGGERRLEQLVTSQVVGNEIAQMQTFRRCVLDVTHVEIEPTAVEKEASVARWFLVIAVV